MSIDYLNFPTYCFIIICLKSGKICLSACFLLQKLAKTLTNCITHLSFFIPVLVKTISFNTVIVTIMVVGKLLVNVANCELPYSRKLLKKSPFNSHKIQLIIIHYTVYVYLTFSYCFASIVQELVICTKIFFQTVILNKASPYFFVKFKQ